MLRNLICWCLLLIIVGAGVTHAQVYQVRAGDTLFISVWGQEELSGLVLVGPDGTVSLPLPVGTLRVKGLTVDEITQSLIQRLSEYIKNPRVSVAIREFEGFVVHVYGQVAAPGFYKIPDNTSLQEVLARAGGPNEYADLAHIQILSRDAEDTLTRVVNFEAFLQDNLLTANPEINENNSVFVPRLDDDTYRKQRISVLGAVQLPGVYPLEAPRSLLDVLALAGGSLPDADLSQIHLFRSPDIPRSDVEVNLEAYLMGNTPLGNPMIEAGQALFVPSTRIPEERKYLVNVIGQVVRPGAYEVTERTQLLDAIYLAGGFADRAQIDKVVLIRRGEQARPESIVDVSAYLLGENLEANPPLAEGDTILVQISEDAMLVPIVQGVFLDSISVNIIGEVRQPGPYELSALGGILDALTLAGGPTPDADLKRAAILRGVGTDQEQLPIDLEEVLTEGTFEGLPTLEANDTIFIPMKKESWWRLFVRAMADVSTIAIAVLILIEGRRP